VDGGVDYAVWDLAVSDITRNNLSVAVAKNGDPTGYGLTMSDSVTVQRNGFSFLGLAANTVAAPESPTTLTFTFDADLPAGFGLAYSHAITAALPVKTATGTYTVAVTAPADTTVTATPSATTYTFDPATLDVAITKTLYTTTFAASGGAADTGDKQDWSAPWAGEYKIELWGAQGGDSTSTTPISDIGGKGGYTYGTIQLAQGGALSVYVGKKGGNKGSGSDPKPGGVGGWNGGGKGGNGCYSNPTNYPGGGGGGGATDVRMGGEGLDNRILVAGGGGGSCTSNLNGGTGGGGNVITACNGGNGKPYDGQSAVAGATQSDGYAPGIGQNGRNASYASNAAEGTGGGGGGYYGGYAKQAVAQFSNAGGGGGSSYVDTSRFTASGGANGSDATYGRSGNGQAKITWVGW
jgi:hypothetical protein